MLLPRLSQSLPLLYRCRHPRATLLSFRNFHMSSPRRANDEVEMDDEDLESDLYWPTATQARELLNDEDFDDDDTTTAGHLQLQDLRQKLYYMRLIEHDMPKLVALRKPFTAPRPSTPLIVRSLYYAGENHPVENKRSIVAPVDELPLTDGNAVHRLKLIAGPRWTPQPPADSGVSNLDTWGDGYIKISCEEFPTPAMNLKWASDTLDKLIAEANNPANKNLDEIPLDTRHFDVKLRKAKKGAHRKRQSPPSVLDFPDEWLPKTPSPKPSQ